MVCHLVFYEPNLINTFAVDQPVGYQAPRDCASAVSVNYFFTSEVLGAFIVYQTGMITLLMLLVLNHRVDQAERQIAVSEAHNNFTNYFKHREYVETLLGNYRDQQAVAGMPILSFVDPLEVHASTFPEAAEGNITCECFYRDIVNLNESVSQNWRGLESVQQRLSEGEHFRTNFQMELANVAKQCKSEVQRFCQKYSISINYDASPENLVATLEDAQVEPFWEAWKELNSFAALIIGCSFSSGNTRRQHFIKEQCAQFPWDFESYRRQLEQSREQVN